MVNDSSGWALDTVYRKYKTSYDQRVKMGKSRFKASSGRIELCV